MNPAFALGVDPIFLHVLKVLDRIQDGESPDPQATREMIRDRFRQTEAMLGQKPGWELGKYALAAWIDDVLINAPWEGGSRPELRGHGWWENNSLEFEFFQKQERATLFFQNAREAMSLKHRDALEIYYICVVLGFRGFYHLEQAPMIADQLQLPTTIEDWAKRTAQAIKLGQGRPPVVENPRAQGTAPPLEGKSLLMETSLASVVLSAIAAMLVRYLLF